MPDAVTDGVRRLVLLRHGQTAWNAERRIQGHSDVPLDATGRAQARVVAPHLAALTPVVLWSSDLARARQTADEIAAVTGLEVRLDARLREFDLGERTGWTQDEYAAAHPDEFREFRAGRYDVVPGGEGVEQVARRMRAALADAVAAVPPGACGIVVSHGGSSKVAVLDLLGGPDVTGAPLLQALANCAWGELDDTGPDRRLRLAAWNVTAPGEPDFADLERVG